MAIPTGLEIVADLLSTDAVRVKPGARAMVEQWGGDKTLEARVRRIEPAGFTKISALGVEEQRVNVVLDFAESRRRVGGAGRRLSRRSAHRHLGGGGRAEGADRARCSATAEKWAVYVVSGDRARRTLVELGHQTGQEAEVLSGLSEGARVILHPGDTLADGAPHQTEIGGLTAQTANRSRIAPGSRLRTR